MKLYYVYILYVFSCYTRLTPIIGYNESWVTWPVYNNRH